MILDILNKRESIGKKGSDCKKKLNFHVLVTRHFFLSMAFQIFDSILEVIWLTPVNNINNIEITYFRTKIYFVFA